MKNRIIALALAFAAASATATAAGIFDNLKYQARLGYNLGGIAPVGMPATIRSLDSYTPKATFTIGLDAYKPLAGRWGIMAGIHFENKGMKTDAKVKNYRMEMRQGGESISGVFTGNVVTDAAEHMLTLPLQATFDLGKKVRLKFGPYFSYVMSANFSGHAYDGYLREGNPTGSKVELGHNEGERGDYDFSDQLRKWQFGLDLGADWYFSHRVGAYAGLTWGLSGAFKKDFKTIEQTMYPIFGTVGVTYKLK